MHLIYVSFGSVKKKSPNSDLNPDERQAQNVS